MAKAKCVVCDQRKGKRSCPAKAAPICPPCCAQNRVDVIACPVDCSFLGAEGSLRLAAKQAGDAPPATMEQVHEMVGVLMDSEPRSRLVSEAEPTAVAALNQLADFVDDDSDGTVEGAIWEWMVFGAQDSDGTPLVDRMVSRLTRPLTAGERSALHAIHRTRYGLFTVEGAPGGEETTVRDLVTEQTLTLTIPEREEPYEAGSHLACFVTPTDRGFTVAMGAWTLPDGTEVTIPDRLRELRKESPLAEVPLPEFLTRLSLVVPLLIFEHFSADADDDLSHYPPPPSF